MFTTKTYIFDTTLRDGEQSPGCSMTTDEKLEIAFALERLKVDVIEAGFAISSPGDFNSVKLIAEKVRGLSVCSLARCNEKDIDAAAEALKSAASPRIHVFIATSDIHMEKKLRMTREQVLEKITHCVSWAKKYMSDVQFSAEDASRSDRETLRLAVETAIAAGATTINIPDTVGYSTPAEMADLIKYLIANAKGADKAVFAVHAHNDLGMATANTLAAISAGARQAEVTLCGIGERAGNAALEEVVMSLHTRRNLFNTDTDIDTQSIYRTTRLLSATIGQHLSPTKPIIGANAFAHEAGIHQHGVMADRNTYEIMCPADIGIPEKAMTLGKHSGKHAFEERLQSMGYNLDTKTLEVIFGEFKKLCDKKKTVTDIDIEALLKHKAPQQLQSSKYTLERFIINSGNTIDATAIVHLCINGEIKKKVAFGDGPVNAAYNAIHKITGDFELDSYSLNSITDGGDALGEVLVRISRNGDSFTGRGLSTDVVEASILAYINAVNKYGE